MLKFRMIPPAWTSGELYYLGVKENKTLWAARIKDYNLLCVLVHAH